MAIQIQAEAHELLPTKPKSKSDGRNDRRPQLSNEKRGGHGGVDSFATHDDKTSAESCPLGDEKHTVPKCENFTKMNPDDRAETAKEVNLCFSCLKSGHRSRECPSSRACGIDNYKKKHHRLLHLSKRVYGNQDSSQHVGVTQHTRRNCQVLLQVVPVILRGPAKNLGSTCSLIQNSIANELGLDGPQERMTLNGIQQRNSILSRKVSFKVNPSCDPGERWSVDQARTIEKLNLPKMTVNMSKEKKRWPHLADLDFPLIDGSRVTVLLGAADVFDLIVPLEILTGPKCTPRAVRTALGWTVTSHICLGPRTLSQTTLCRLTFPRLTKTFESKCKVGGKPNRLVASLPR